CNQPRVHHTAPRGAEGEVDARLRCSLSICWVLGTSEDRGRGVLNHAANADLAISSSLPPCSARYSGAGSNSRRVCFGERQEASADTRPRRWPCGGAGGGLHFCRQPHGLRRTAESCIAERCSREPYERS